MSSFVVDQSCFVKQMSSEAILMKWQEAERKLIEQYGHANVPDLVFGEHMRRHLDPFVYAYFAPTPTCFSCPHSTVWDADTHEAVDTTIVFCESRDTKMEAQRIERVEFECCTCCKKPITTQQNMVWQCWYCSADNHTRWRHPDCTENTKSVEQESGSTSDIAESSINAQMRPTLLSRPTSATVSPSPLQAIRSPDPVSTPDKARGDDANILSNGGLLSSSSASVHDGKTHAWRDGEAKSATNVHPQSTAGATATTATAECKRTKTASATGTERDSKSNVPPTAADPTKRGKPTCFSSSLGVNDDWLAWLHAQTDAFLWEIYEMGRTQVLGTDRVLIIDDQGAFLKRPAKLFVQPVAVIASLQDDLGPLPTFILTALEKRAFNFPVLYDSVHRLSSSGTAMYRSNRTANFPVLITHEQKAVIMADPSAPITPTVVRQLWVKTFESLIAITHLLAHPPK